MAIHTKPSVKKPKPRRLSKRDVSPDVSYVPDRSQLKTIPEWMLLGRWVKSGAKAQFVWRDRTSDLDSRYYSLFSIDQTEDALPDGDGWCVMTVEELQKLKEEEAERVRCQGVVTTKGSRLGLPCSARGLDNGYCPAHQSQAPENRRTFGPEDEDGKCVAIMASGKEKCSGDIWGGSRGRFEHLCLCRNHLTQQRRYEQGDGLPVVTIYDDAAK